MHSSLSKLVDILFHRINPERVLNWLICPEYGTFSERLQSWFMDVAETNFCGYSEDEQRLFWQRINETCVNYATREIPPVPWYLLVDYGEKSLTYTHGEPQCRFEKVLDWRETYLQLGQDLIVTAWLGYNHIHHRLNLDNYSWLPILQSDNAILESLLREGLAENHYHLNGSADIFAITWSCIMTYPTEIKETDWLNSFLVPAISRGTGHNVWDGKKRLVYAAYIRLLLFETMHGQNREIIKRFQRFDRAYGFIGASFVEGEAVLWRELYSPLFAQPDTPSKYCLDYTLYNCQVDDDDDPYRLLCGERKFLVDCFERCFTGEFNVDTQILFYAYILIKAQFRTELIQANKQIGFANFSNYEKRKKSLWKRRKYYSNEVYRTALVGPLSQTPVSSIEARTCPDNTMLEMVRSIHKIDCAVLFAGNNYESTWKVAPYMENPARDFKYYYVWHFPKQIDESVWRSPRAELQCRHFKLRQLYKHQAMAFVKALFMYQYFWERTRGIDACNNEISCRPEVFANVFRYIREYVPCSEERVVFFTRRPHIAITFHAGEDFLDIADGLRAIDEATLFLGMSRGDRIGHGLALGVDPKTHYQTKSSVLILPKQDCLDNLTWICERSAELNVVIAPELKSRLYSKAMDLLYDIYGEAVKNEPWGNSISLRDYHLSWFLRGDAPIFYQTGKFWNSGLHDVFDSYGVNSTPYIEHLASYRKHPIFSSLNYYYHYSGSVKNVGQQTTIFEVTSDYIGLMEQMQRAMQTRLNDMGISIECNPSSNVLIGTFRDYDKHPLFRFNSNGLTNIANSAQMHISINTDDRGVFDTSLPFEYIMIAATLAQQQDDNNRRLHSDREIENYLRNLQRMSKEQIFPENNL